MKKMEIQNFRFRQECMKSLVGNIHTTR